MDDFIFRGVHCREMGAVAAFGESTTAGSRIRRREYAMPGGGRIEIGEPGYESTTRNVTITPADGMPGDWAWARRIATWLCAGRGRLILDHDPQVYRIAQFDEAPAYGAKSWPLGALEMRMTLQPLCCAVRKSSFSAQTAGGEATIKPSFDTGIKAPLELTIAPVDGVITAAEIFAGGKRLEMAGMALAPGQTLTYYAGDTHGEAAAMHIGDAPAFAYCQRWQQIEVGSGEEIRLQVTGGEARVTAALRGRWVT